MAEQTSLKQKVTDALKYSIIAWIAIWVIFTFAAYNIIQDPTVTPADAFPPFVTLNWMYTPSSEIFGITIFLTVVAGVSFLALQFYPGFQKKALIPVLNNSMAENIQEGGAAILRMLRRRRA